MTEPMGEFSTPEPSNVFQQTDDVLNNYGPDPTNVTDPPLDAKRKFSNPLKNGNAKPSMPLNLGHNKKRASGVRQLAAADKEKIASLYMIASMATMPLSNKVSMAFLDAKEECAEAWFELAREHDGVRKFILAIIEGGAWGKVFAAHIPIMFAAMPEKFVEQRLAGLFDKPVQETGDDE